MYFDSAEEVTHVLHEEPKRIVFLITSGGLGREVVPKVNELVHISRIYIFCVNVDANKEWSKQYNKVQEVFNLEDDLYKQLADDLARVYVQQANSCVKDDNRGIGRLLYNDARQLLINILRLQDNHHRVQEIDEQLTLMDAI
ncbi:unnamed protein product [Didymodactylos carnosus]|uniref:Uncharacterized protein n=1 Tax=Didymodactylos carnosus TaxID=1234261 RepID=A0A814WQY4_9BILA|nr:unnamed protein product [Didymodactylos carnosus]CAF1508801.1 unnamed protein product [Didymodactylos carnosus]CAF3969297.1 unnamed protein product [Didymodactylos carnosus]CAF4296811.1 unnamed protein product [Didymodactylos carnosus]